MKTTLITGSNQGISFETASQLEALGYFVYMGCRDPAKGRAALDKPAGSGAVHIALVEIDITNSSSALQAIWCHPTGPAIQPRQRSKKHKGVPFQKTAAPQSSPAA